MSCVANEPHSVLGRPCGGVRLPLGARRDGGCAIIFLMHGHLLVSISSIFDDTRRQAADLLEQFDKADIPVSLLVAPHIDGNWHLAKDSATQS